MRYAFILLVVFAFGCKKSAQQSYSFEQILDSMGIVAGRPCIVENTNGHDTITFSSNATITETCYGKPISYSVMYSLYHVNGYSHYNTINIKYLGDTDVSQSLYYVFTKNFETIEGYDFETIGRNNSTISIGGINIIKL